ncbi:hypothetical protein VL10_ORF27 [Staphylococcus phage vB_SauM_VL10]|nr:hypothetical protein VL10_ORF27 [Staphylococcus phage vB_SauM_VL10]
MDDKELLTLYKGIANYIYKKDSRLLNETQLLVIKKHEHNLRKLYNKLRREKRINKIKKFTRELPENILYFISLLMSCVSYPFYYIESKVEDLYTYISNRNIRTYRAKTINDLNRYISKNVLPELKDKIKKEL